MSNVMAGSLNGIFPELSDDKLEVVSILINNACNLRCRHCYLQRESSRDHLSAGEWEKFLESLFSEMPPSILSFAGKEVFINSKSVSLLLNAVKLRNQSQANSKKTQIGVITNGTLIQHFRDRLLRESAPDYFDVSVDGLPQTHDAIRGAGAFAQLQPNLRWLVRHFSPNVWITHTLSSDNLKSLPEFIHFYHRNFQLQNFSIGLYRELAYTDPTLALSNDHLIDFIDRVLPSLENLSLESPVTIQLELDVTQRPVIELFAQAGWANPLDPISTVRHGYRNGLSVHIHTTRIPVGLWRSVRISPEGYWLAAEDLLRAREYHTLKVAALRDYDFNVPKLYQAALKSARYRELWGGKPAMPQAIVREMFLTPGD